MRQAKLIPILVYFLLCVTSQAMAAEISVTNPWIREAPPGAEALAAYMTIDNHSSKIVTLVSVSSPDFPMILLHLTTMQNGMAHMQKQSTLQIAPGSRIVLEPGGYHLMLMHPAHPIKTGDKVELQFHLGNGDAIDVTALVRK